MKFINADDLIVNRLKFCPILGYRIMNPGCQKPYKGDWITLNEKNFIIEKPIYYPETSR